MTRILRWLAVAGAVLFAILAVSTYAASALASDKGAEFMAEATYQTECVSGGSAAGSAQCQRAEQQRVQDWPMGIPTTDRELILTWAEMSQTVAGAMLALSGLFLTVTGLLLTVATLLRGRPRERVPRSHPAPAFAPPGGQR